MASLTEIGMAKRALSFVMKSKGELLFAETHEIDESADIDNEISRCLTEVYKASRPHRTHEQTGDLTVEIRTADV